MSSTMASIFSLKFMKKKWGLASSNVGAQLGKIFMLAFIHGELYERGF
jgi:hypothetical protein